MVISKENLEKFLTIYNHINKIEKAVVNNPRFSKDQIYNYLYNIVFSHEDGFHAKLQSIYRFELDYDHDHPPRTNEGWWKLWKKKLDETVKVLTTVTKE